MRYSQVRTDALAWKAGSPRQAATQSLLQRVVGVLKGAEQPVAVHVQFAAMRPDQLGKGRLVAGAGQVQQRAVGHMRRSPLDGSRPGGR